MQEVKWDVEFNTIRKTIKDCAKTVIIIRDMYCVRPTNKIEDRRETMANLELAYRHLEDASMRLGKAIQAYDGGVSVYDKSSTVGA